MEWLGLAAALEDGRVGGMVGGTAVVRWAWIPRGAVGVRAVGAVGRVAGGGYDAVASATSAAAAAGKVEIVERVGIGGGGGVGIGITIETVGGDAAAWVGLLVDNLEVLVLRDLLLFAHFEARTLRTDREINDGVV